MPAGGEHSADDRAANLNLPQITAAKAVGIVSQVGDYFPLGQDLNRRERGPGDSAEPHGQGRARTRNLPT